MSEQDARSEVLCSKCYIITWYEIKAADMIRNIESLCLGQALGVILIIEGRYPGIQAPQFMIYELLPFWLKCYLSWSLVQDFICPHPQVTSVRKSATARCYLEG